MAGTTKWMTRAVCRYKLKGKAPRNWRLLGQKVHTPDAHPFLRKRTTSANLGEDLNYGTPASVSDWQCRGACNAADPEMFFHPDGERGGSRQRRIDKAKQVCATCPVLEMCRAYVLSHKEPYGVWGGMSEEERARAYSRKRRLAAHSV